MKVKYRFRDSKKVRTADNNHSKWERLQEYLHENTERVMEFIPAGKYIAAKYTYKSSEFRFYDEELLRELKLERLVDDLDEKLTEAEYQQVVEEVNQIDIDEIIEEFTELLPRSEDSMEKLDPTTSIVVGRSEYISQYRGTDEEIEELMEIYDLDEDDLE